MKTEAEMNADILKITETIQEEFPELSKYMAEMPVTISNEMAPHVNQKSLQDYYDSLENLLTKYRTNHNK